MSLSAIGAITQKCPGTWTEFIIVTWKNYHMSLSRRFFKSGEALMSIMFAILLALHGVLYQKVLHWRSSLMIGISNNKRVALRREPLGALEQQLVRSQSYSPLTTFERVKSQLKRLSTQWVRCQGN